VYDEDKKTKILFHDLAKLQTNVEKEVEILSEMVGFLLSLSHNIP